MRLSCELSDIIEYQWGLVRVILFPFLAPSSFEPYIGLELYMLKKMHPDKALELRATLKALREQLHSDSGEHMKRRKASMHPELMAMKVEKMDMEPKDSDHPDVTRMDETHTKGDGEHPGRGWQPDDDVHGKEMYSDGGEVEYPEKKERPAPPMPHYDSGGTVESDHDTALDAHTKGGHMDDDETIEAHRKLLERIRNDY